MSSHSVVNESMVRDIRRQKSNTDEQPTEDDVVANCILVRFEFVLSKFGVSDDLGDQCDN